MKKKQKPKKILVLQAFPLWGCGSGTYVRELAREINKDKDTKIAIVSPQGSKQIAGFKIYPLEFPFPVAFTGHPEWPVCKLYNQLKPKELTRVFNYFLRSVVNAVDEFQPDLIHVHHVSLLLWIANMIKDLYGINYIVTAHGTGIMAAEEKKYFIPQAQTALKKAKMIVPVSHHSKQRILQTFGEDLKNKIRIIPGGINLDKYPKDRKIRIINKKYKLRGKKVILFTGKITDIKGVKYLIEAAKDIKGDVYIIGDGPAKKSLEDLKYKLNLENVHFLGYMGNDKRQEFEEFYYRADVFVIPSIVDEGLPLVVLEAMACSTPVVGTKKGGINTIVKDELNGLLVKAKSSKQIATACNKIIENKKMRRKMAEMARKTVEDKFTWKKIAQKYTVIYNQAYQNGKGK